MMERTLKIALIVTICAIAIIAVTTTVLARQDVLDSDNAQLRPGEALRSPALDVLGPGSISLVATDQLPALSAEQAHEALRALGAPAPFQESTELIETHYGLGTWGQWVTGKDGSTVWLGPIDFKLQSGEVVKRFENRPMWLLVFDDGSGVPDRYSAYIIDEASGDTLIAWGWD